MKVFAGIEEFEAAVGTQLGTSEWIEVTQQMIDDFADATHDHQWIHVDPERAKDGPFGTTIAHGYLTLSLVSTIFAQVYKVEQLKLGLNYGSNKVRFPTVVPVNSRVRGHVELISVATIPMGRQAISKVTIELEGSEKPACVAEIVSVLVP